MRSILLKTGLHLLFVAILIVVLMPLGWMVMSSLKPVNELFNVKALFPRVITLENFARLFTGTKFLNYMANSLVVSITVVLATTGCATICAYTYNRVRFKGRTIMGWLTLLLYMISPIMIVIPLYTLFRNLSLGNTLTGLMIGHFIFVFPFAFWMLNSFFRSLPVEIEQASIIDGAGFLQTFFFIVIPNAFQAILAVATFTFILSWNDYALARILITGDEKKTIPVGLEDMFMSTVTDWSIIMAAGVVISMPVILAYVLVARLSHNNNYLKFS